MKTFWAAWSRWTLASATAAASALALGEDRLLYKSDPWNLALFVSGLGLAAALAALVPGAASSLIRRRNANAAASAGLAGRITLALIVATMSWLALDTFAFDWQQRMPVWLPPALLAVPCWWLAGALSRVPTVPPSLARLAAAVTVACLAVHPAMRVSQALASPPAAETRVPGVVLVVVDGLGAEYLKPFNPAATVPTPNLDALAAESAVFLRHHTTANNTRASFMSLYTGHYLVEHIGKKDNLYARLKHAGVTARLIASHNNALPDVSDFRYSGLRSAYIPQFYSWIPRLFGAEYHVFRYRDPERGGRGMVHGKRGQAVLEFLNGPFEFRGALRTALDEAADLASRKKPFLVVCHLFTHGYDPTAQQVMWKKSDSAELESIKANHNRYRPDQQAFIDDQRKKYERGIRSLDRALGAFLEEYERRGWKRKIPFVLTSDHGFAFDRGEFAYTYHHSETVMRTPLVLLSDRGRGVERRPTDQADVYATLFDLFGLAKPELESSRSVLEPERKPFSVAISHGGPVVVYRGDEKHVFLPKKPDFRLTYLESFRTGEDGTESRYTPEDRTLIDVMLKQKFWHVPSGD